MDGSEPKRRADGLDFMGLACIKSASRYMTGGEKAGQLNRWQRLNLDDSEAHPYDPSKDHISYADLHLLLASALRSMRLLDRELIHLLGDRQDWWEEVEGGETIPAMRFARNVVEHERAELIDLAGKGVSGVERHDIWETVWVDYTPRTSGRFGEDAYRGRFAGASIVTSLTGLCPPLLSGILRVGPSRAP